MIMGKCTSLKSSREIIFTLEVEAETKACVLVTEKLEPQAP